MVSASLSFPSSSVLLYLLLLSSGVVEAVPVVQVPDVSELLQNILQNTDRSELYRYPTDLTRFIVPVPFHSHNDYWQDVPFYKALSYGAMSIEGDVWFINGTLYLGHDTSSLTPQRILATLYIDPILHVLQGANPPSPYAESLPTFGGTKPEIGTLNAVLAAIEPLRSAGYLTTWHASNNSIVKRPITAIGTGEMNLASVLGQTPLRDVFYDSPLFNLTFEENKNIAGPEVSPLASGHFTEAFGKVTKADFFAQNETAPKVLRDQLRVAHDKKIMGIDLLNIDDPEGCTSFWEGKG
ncbi:hypothetical protein BKA81DRAFT_386660 [Phyllosticta paracitricarpa]|uniref:Altered inheritance of mitochondria protein 6 n=1 Tax=Phyllosticta paracitricarpa TaxID=2016321 RepID=A0ABR1NLN0_9PEZI